MTEQIDAHAQESIAVYHVIVFLGDTALIKLVLNVERCLSLYLDVEIKRFVLGYVLMLLRKPPKSALFVGRNLSFLHLLLTDIMFVAFNVELPPQNILNAKGVEKYFGLKKDLIDIIVVKLAEDHPVL